MTGSMVRIELPFPPAELTPHAKGYWRKKASATRRYRLLCAQEAMAQGVQRMDGVKAVSARVTLHRPNQRRDYQNCISCFKAGVDGIADAAKLDDRHWKIDFVEGEPDRPKGRVVVEIEVMNNG